MAILLASSPDLLLPHAARHSEKGLIALLFDGESALAEALSAVVESPILVDVNGPRLSRVNFDAVALVILDLSLATLLGSAGRRLSDALGRLAEDELTLAFAGEATTATGMLLEDGVTAGLNLIPQAVVIPAVQTVPDLHSLLARVSEQGVRLLALDAPITAEYHYGADRVAVAGSGSVLLVGFVTSADGERPTARLHALTDGMQDGWPA
jgi:hypothetical protein